MIFPHYPNHISIEGVRRGGVREGGTLTRYNLTLDHSAFKFLPYLNHISAEGVRRGGFREGGTFNLSSWAGVKHFPTPEVAKFVGSVEKAARFQR